MVDSEREGNLLIQNGNIIIDQSQKCAGKGCNKPGIRKLKIIFVGKVGLFCENCANTLLELKIATLE